VREKKRGYNVISERGEGRDIVGENIIGALKYEIIMEVLSNYSFFQYYDRNIGLFSIAAHIVITFLTLH
jgi:hypothetical protein